jgi:RimJ/RimL family protein N-acetyltransferase
MCNAAVMLVVLPSGYQVHVRPIRSADKLLLADGLARLSPQSRFRRFHGAKPRLTARELRYLTEVDGVDHQALVATKAGEPDLIVATARYVRDAQDPTVADVAVVVGDELQGQGLGAVLGRELARRARAAGIARFVADVQPDNPAAHRLLAHLRAELAAEVGPPRAARSAALRDRPGGDLGGVGVRPTTAA